MNNTTVETRFLQDLEETHSKVDMEKILKASKNVTQNLQQIFIF